MGFGFDSGFVAGCGVGRARGAFLVVGEVFVSEVAEAVVIMVVFRFFLGGSVDSDAASRFLGVLVMSVVSSVLCWEIFLDFGFFPEGRSSNDFFFETFIPGGLSFFFANPSSSFSFFVSSVLSDGSFLAF